MKRVKDSASEVHRMRTESKHVFGIVSFGSESGGFVEGGCRRKRVGWESKWGGVWWRWRDLGLVVEERGNEEELKKNVEMREDEEEAMAIDVFWVDWGCLCLFYVVVCGSCNVGLRFQRDTCLNSK